MQNEPEHFSNPPVRVSERIVEQDVFKEIREVLGTTEAGPEYIWREHVQSRSKETFKEETK